MKVVRECGERHVLRRDELTQGEVYYYREDDEFMIYTDEGCLVSLKDGTQWQAMDDGWSEEAIFETAEVELLVK